MKTFFMVLQIISLMFPTAVFAETIKGKVLSIHDGDTLTFVKKNENKKSILRLLGVDTPEVDFNGFSQGEVATIALDYLRSQLPIDSIIEIELPKIGGIDVNGRFLGRVIYAGRDLNLEMLQKGFGAMYFIFPYDKKLLADYSMASRLASSNHLGIFSDKYHDLELPYLFRQRTKGVAGTNIIGNYETKKLYSGEDIELIPHYLRVFFSDSNIAISRGFSW
ncbi:MAG: thermonuclease family protein [Bdellovibrionales bacterium]|nr:thermonuclease family protein [Bdellovibrionales bacterium]